MMEPPFYGSYFQTPTPPSHDRAPVNMRSVPNQTTPSPPRKVVSIPVHFVDSVRKRSSSALKIQKTFRGFRVRKTVKKILELKRQVDGVEKKLHEKATMEVIKRDRMERLKINETLMALLFELDSVQGFNDEVRDFRKGVIKKAIMLQELIDSAVVDDNCATKKDSEEFVEDDSGIVENSEGIVENTEGIVENTEGIDLNNVSVTDIHDDSSKVYVEEKSEVIEDDFSKMQVEDSEKVDSDEIAKETLEKSEDVTSEGIDGATAMQVETLDAGQNWECVGEETEPQKSGFVGEEDDHGEAGNHCEEERNSFKELWNDEWCVVGGGDEEKERKEKLLLEKMAEDNQRLMAMVADLCQKNATQTKMICSLSQRVEQLEKAMSERLRKKKKCNVLHN